ncbi:putative OsmC-like protein [Neorhizobium galegae]|uniref:OsmC family protein n=1 Tax=Neorhizobium galegae TaxID=399 RepID=UPI001AE7F7E0|nr:OsmC family protein [Neorhizobium galegae]MBP2562559.1 putative OsmC-like protein [Neorhizobium galegae]
MTSTTKPFADINTIRETQEAVSKQPELGKVTFKLKGKSSGGLAMVSKTGPLVQNGKADSSRDGKFSLVSDEPIALLGTDTGANPAEYVLHALAGCYTVTLASMAAEKGVDLSGLELDLGFDIDLNGFLGLDKSVRKGATAITVDLKLTSETSNRAQLEELIAELPNNSPIYDTIANPVKITNRLV